MNPFPASSPFTSLFGVPAPKEEKPNAEIETQPDFEPEEIPETQAPEPVSQETVDIPELKDFQGFPEESFQEEPDQDPNLDQKHEDPIGLGDQNQGLGSNFDWAEEPDPPVEEIPEGRNIQPEQEEEENIETATGIPGADPIPFEAGPAPGFNLFPISTHEETAVETEMEPHKPESANTHVDTLKKIEEQEAPQEKNVQEPSASNPELGQQIQKEPESPTANPEPENLNISPGIPLETPTRGKETPAEQPVPTRELQPEIRTMPTQAIQNCCNIAAAIASNPAYATLNDEQVSQKALAIYQGIEKRFLNQQGD